MTTKGAGAKFGVDSHSRKGKTNTDNKFNDREVQSSSGERRSLGGEPSDRGLFALKLLYLGENFFKKN